MLLSPLLLESRGGGLHSTAAGRSQTSGSMLSLSRTAPSTGTNQASPETKVRALMKHELVVSGTLNTSGWFVFNSYYGQCVCFGPLHHSSNVSTIAIAVLKDKEPGSFLIRDSNSFQGAYGLALKVATPPPNANFSWSKGIYHKFSLFIMPQSHRLRD